MGPHLHFEVRESVTERPLNPGLFLHLGDERAPNVRGVYVYHFSKEGYLLARHKFGVKMDENGVYQVGKLTMASGKVGIGIQADDFMKGSWNKLGVYDMRMYVKGCEIFAMRMDTMSFEQNRLVNELKDFDLYKKGEMVYMTFGNYQSRLLGVRSVNDGLIQLVRDSVLPVEFVLSDINENCSRMRLSLQGGDTVSELVVDSSVLLLDYWRVRAWRVGSYCLTVDSNAIPRVIKVESKIVRIVVDSFCEREIFWITDEAVPLLKNARLRVKGEFSKKHVLCLVDEKGKLSPLRTWWDGQELCAETRLLGSYSVAIDTISPMIRYLGVQNRNVCFRVRDYFSRIGVYRGEVNGRWCLFVYDAKRNLLSASLQEPVFRKGKIKLF